MKIHNLLFGSLFLIASISQAEEESLLVDKNGDGSISVLAVGDSITYGIGDTFDPEDVEPDFGGYPARLTTLLGVPVVNEGEPGEELVADGARRFSALMQSSSADVVLILEGANDAFNQVDSSDYRSSLQRVINIAKALGKTPVIMTLPSPCCEHGQLIPLTTAYSGVVNNLGIINNIKVADLRTTWNTTCTSGECQLYRLPEGLHPNPTGYDAVSQTIASYLLGINIFTAEGAANLEEALGLAPGTVIVKPILTEAP